MPDLPEKQQKPFFTYQQQIEHLKSKKLIIKNEDLALHYLKQYSYYSLISAYKDIFKVEKNGDYKSGITFENIMCLYNFDSYLRQFFLEQILKVENHIKSLYSYAFCELYGDRQADYMNVNNYNYTQYQDEVNMFVNKVGYLLTKKDRHSCISYNMEKYHSVPLWVLIHVLTLGNLSKMFEFSRQQLQSKIAREFKCIYEIHLTSMLNVLSKFRNVCAHTERLYNYHTRNGIKDMPVHKNLQIAKKGNEFKNGKNDLFSVVVCLKYLFDENDFQLFYIRLKEIIDASLINIDMEYKEIILKSMGFPENWKKIGSISKK